MKNTNAGHFVWPASVFSTGVVRNYGIAPKAAPDPGSTPGTSTKHPGLITWLDTACVAQSETSLQGRLQWATHKTARRLIARTIAHIYEVSAAPFEQVLDYLRDEIPDIKREALHEIRMSPTCEYSPVVTGTMQ